MTFALMASPSDAAKEAFESIGLSTEKLATTLTTKGLVPAVQLLADHLEKVGTTAERASLLTEAFGGGRSSATIATLLQNVDDLRLKYHDLGETAGDFNEKLAEARAEPINQLKIAGNKLQVIMEELGSKLVPAVTSAFTEVVDVISDPKIEASEKLSKIADMAGAAIADLIPKAAALGLKIGGGLVTGIIDGFIHGSTAAKAAIATAMIALFGGKAAFVKIGALMAAPFIEGFAAAAGGAQILAAGT